MRLEVPLRSPHVVSFIRRARGPSVELDSRIRTDADLRQGTQKLGVLAAFATFRESAVRTLLGLALLHLALVLLLLLDLRHERERALRRHVEFQFFLEVVQLLHEVEVGGDVRFALPDQVKRVVQIQRAFVH